MAAYVEDGLAGVIRCAAEFGMIPGVTAERVYTDEDAVSEWEGEDKVYVARGEQTPVYDVTSPTGSAHCTIGEFALVALSGSRRTAQLTAGSVWDSVLKKFSDESWAEVYEGGEAPRPLFWQPRTDSASLDPRDEASVEYGLPEAVDLLDEVKNYESLLYLSASDEMFLAGADRWKASAFDFEGDVSGAGVWIGGAMFSADPQFPLDGTGTARVTFRTSRLGVLSWCYDRYNTVPRADGGSYSDEWFSTHTIKTVSMND